MSEKLNLFSSWSTWSGCDLGFRHGIVVGLLARPTDEIGCAGLDWGLLADLSRHLFAFFLGNRGTFLVWYLIQKKYPYRIMKTLKSGIILLSDDLTNLCTRFLWFLFATLRIQNDEHDFNFLSSDIFSYVSTDRVSWLRFSFLRELGVTKKQQIGEVYLSWNICAFFFWSILTSFMRNCATSLLWGLE